MRTLLIVVARLMNHLRTWLLRQRLRHRLGLEHCDNLVTRMHPHAHTLFRFWLTDGLLPNHSAKNVCTAFTATEKQPYCDFSKKGEMGLELFQPQPMRVRAAQVF